MASSSPEKNIGQLKEQETAPATVTQPGKIVELSAQLGSFLEGINDVSENAGSKPGEQWSDGSGTTATAGSAQTGKAGMSARDEAIANIPAPAVMQKELEKHIRTEVKKLRKQARQIARISKPGAAYHASQMYMRIRHLNALLAEILNSSYEVVKRMFIKVFIDKQSIL